MREGTGIAGGIAGGLVVGFIMLPALLVVSGFLFLFGYAVVKLIGEGGMTAPAVVVGFVLLAAAFPLLIAVGVGILGRGLAPRKGAEPDNR